MTVQRELSLGFSIIDLARLFRQRFERAVSRSGLDVTAGEARTLLHLADIGSVRQTVLAERMLVEPMSLSNVLDRLEARGLVARRTDPSDRRAKLVATTPAAAQTIARLGDIATTVRESATAGLDADDVARMRHAFGVMRANLAGDGASATREAAE